MYTLYIVLHLDIRLVAKITVCSYNLVHVFDFHLAILTQKCLHVILIFENMTKMKYYLSNIYTCARQWIC